MGALSALIVGPCVAAPLAGALLYISQSRDVVLGGSALFAMALGMGVPLLAVGASAGALLPKAGPWMETVKRFFGVLLLGVAIYLVSPLVPPVVRDAGVGRAAHRDRHLSARDRPACRRARAASTASPRAWASSRWSPGSRSWSARCPAAATSCSRSPGCAARRRRGGAPVAFKRVELGRASSTAPSRRRAGRPVMLDFYADWCVSCKEMERYTFSDPQVRERLAEVVKLQADVTANAAEHQALLKRFRLFGPPGIVFFDREGREIEGLRVIGFQPAERFANVLDQVLAFERRRMTLARTSR